MTSDYEEEAPDFAVPAAPKRSKLTAPASVNGTMPSDRSAEEHVIACCFLDQGPSLTRARSVLSPESFYYPELAILFRQLSALQDDKLPLDEATLLEYRGSHLTGINPMLLLQLTDPSRYPTTVHAGRMIGRVADLHRRRALLKHAAEITDAIKSGVETSELPGERLLQDIPTAREPRAHRPISSYAYPTSDDPNILIGSDDYLGRGGGLLFISFAGMGKSSWIMDAFMSWAIGEPWMGFVCHKPRRCLLIQGEDSDRYVGKIVQSFIHVRRLSPEKIKLLDENFRMIRLRGVSGKEFEAQVAVEVAEFKPDLVGINPIYIYAEGDIGRSEYAQPFLQSLDRINKAESFAWVLVHHTGKPAKDSKGNRPTLDDWESAYMGFGSSYFANWPRCTLMLEPVPKSSGHFCIRLGKGGANAGIVKELTDGNGGFKYEKATRIAIRHSSQVMPVGDLTKPVYYWELDDEAPSEADLDASRPGRRPKYEFADISKWVPTSATTALAAQQIHKHAESYVMFSKTATKGILLRALETGLVKAIEKPGLGPCFYIAQ